MSGKIEAFVLTVVTSGARKGPEGVKKDFYSIYISIWIILIDLALLSLSKQTKKQTNNGQKVQVGTHCLIFFNES